jgi:hypothetical protein
MSVPKACVLNTWLPDCWKVVEPYRVGQEEVSHWGDMVLEGILGPLPFPISLFFSLDVGDFLWHMLHSKVTNQMIVHLKLPKP